MSLVLVAYATKRGSTREVAEAVARTLREQGFDVELEEADKVEDIEPYDGVVLGGALYMGHWHTDARDFLRRHSRALRTVPFAAFAMGPRTLEEPDVANSRQQLEHELLKAPSVEPVSVAIFGGVVDPTKLRFPFSRMRASDARDWEAIGAWAAQVAGEFGAHVPAASC